MVKDPNLEFLANQGVLLINAGLTTEANKAGKHTDIWQPFIKFLIEEVINPYPRELPVVFLGREAERYSKILVPFHHTPFIREHMAAASYAGRNWEHKELFKLVDSFLLNNYNDKIFWTKELVPF